MITNATLTRIDAKTGVTPLGEPVYTTGEAISVRGLIDDPSGTQRLTLGATIKDAAWVLYVATDALGDITGPAEGDRVVVGTDGGTAITADVVLVKTYELGNVSHTVAFLKRV